MNKRFIIPLCLVMFVLAPVQANSRSDVLAKLNNSSSTKGSEDVKSWKIFFDGCLQITAPPKAISESFNMNTVWPGVEGWDALAAWAQTNEHMAGVFIESAKRPLIGLPYGAELVSDLYQQNGVVAEIGVNGHLHNIHFGYVDQVELAYLWCTVELYRLFEAGEMDRAIELLMSELVVLRKFCDREFLKEQLTFMPMLSEALANTRDMFYEYRESLTPSQFRSFAKEGIPYLRADSTRLLMPEGDRVVGEALLNDLFTPTGEPDSAKFREVLTDIQSRKEPVTRFGAAKYWESIAKSHRGRDDSLDRLNRIYDDWWRRWKMRAFHPQLSVDSELQKSNPVNFAGVNLIIRDIQSLFIERDFLTTQINSTAVAAALCGYRNHYGVYPKSVKMMYAQLLHRSSNLDMFRPLTMRTDADWTLYEFSVGPFYYRKISKKTRIQTLAGNVFVEDGQCLLYSVSGNNEDDRGLNSGDDLILWPPLKSMQRNAGLVD
jgi:hypothetical protein